MKSEDAARPHFEKYMRNLSVKIDRSKDGEYTEVNVENSWMDYLVGWTHCALLKADEERARLLKQLAEMRGET